MSPALFPLADPVMGCTATVMYEGDTHGWHFDLNDFVVSILLQAPEAGGTFDFAPNIRQDGEENYAASPPLWMAVPKPSARSKSRREHCCFSAAAGLCTGCRRFAARFRASLRYSVMTESRVCATEAKRMFASLGGAPPSSSREEVARESHEIHLSRCARAGRLMGHTAGVGARVPATRSTKSS